MEEQNKTLRFEIYALGAAEINVVSYSYLKYKNSNIDVYKRQLTHIVNLISSIFHKFNIVLHF